MNHPVLAQTVESSLLSSLAYSTDTTLELQFRRGAICRYSAVPPAIFQALIVAPSKGAYFNRHIRNRCYYQRLA